MQNCLRSMLGACVPVCDTDNDCTVQSRNGYALASTAYMACSQVTTRNGAYTVGMYRCTWCLAGMCHTDGQSPSYVLLMLSSCVLHRDPGMLTTETW